MGKTMQLLAMFVLVITAGCSSDESSTDQSPEIPDDVAVLIDDWYDAANKADGSVMDLYLPEAYHLYGDERIEFDEISDHLGGSDWEHEWITESILITEQPEGQFVVVRGMSNSHPQDGTDASAFMFEIKRRADGSLGISETAWFYRN